MKAIRFALLALAAGLASLCLASLAFGQTTPDPSKDLGGYAKALYDATAGHHWVLLVGLVLMGVTWGVRKLVPMIHGKVGAWLNTDRGGALLSLGLGLVGGIATAFAAGKAVTFQLLASAVVASWTASGGWSQLKKILGLSDPPAAK